jgi:hypothetical protein
MELKPGTIHAVLSLDACSHLALDICAKRDFVQAKLNMEWEIQWLAKSASAGRGFQKSRAETSLGILDIWESVAEGEGQAAKRRKTDSIVKNDVEKLKEKYSSLIKRHVKVSPSHFDFLLMFFELVIIHRILFEISHKYINCLAGLFI